MDPDSEFISLIIQIIHLVRSVDFDSQPKPESKLMSLTTQTISLFNSMDLDSQPKALKKLISSISNNLFLPNSTIPDSKFRSLVLQLMDFPESKPDLKFMSRVGQTWSLEPRPELISLIHQILSHVIPMISNLKKLISLCPQVKVRLEQGKFCIDEEVQLRSNIKWECLPINWKKFRFIGEDASHFLCRGCNGKNHEGYNKAPFEIKHPLHQKHSLQLALLSDEEETRKCYCCDEDLMEVFYYCLACDYAMNIVCVEKPRLLSIDHPKWHEHTLALFPRKAFLTCDLCACADSSCPFYICPPCDFVVHQSCISLPRVIRISRHHHHISFTPSFYQGEWSCGVCHKKINNDYGGYSCIKNGCLYAAHSKCATQSNVWDGKELEEEPEEIEEAVECFVKISDGIIQHFSHEHHHLRLDENANRDYDENKLCQACIMPIYNGNFYSCMQCDFILHETCANYPRIIHHPIHPHLLTLVIKYDTVIKDDLTCSACPWYCTTGFFYRCSKEGCCFKLHVQCATISEPLIHESSVHPLFLTSKPGERRICSVCKDSRLECTNETFNCIEDRV